MKILLVGEFSGFHRALKLGLESLGHNVTLAGSPDGFKKIPIDVNLWPSEKWGKYKKFNAFLKQFTISKELYKLKCYDIVQFISPLKFHNSIPFYGKWFNSYCYKKLIKQNKLSFLVACGNDPIYVQIGRKQMDYNPIDAEINYSNVIPQKIRDYKALEWNKKLAKKVNGVIPAAYEYKIGYKTFEDKINLSSVIPMPIHISEYNFNENILCDGKVRILHGITRPGMKGSNYIIEALKRIDEEYPDDVIIDIVERLPLEEYHERVLKCNILIDQCNTYCYGINALIGLSMGKVVMSGCEPEEMKSLGVDESPVINIRPDIDDIYSKIEQIVLNKNNIQKLGKQSRKYVEEVHDAVNVAERYIKFWNTGKAV